MPNVISNKISDARSKTNNKFLLIGTNALFIFCIGAAGLIVSMNRILTKALMPGNQKANTIIFFVISITMVVFCCVIFHSSRRTDFVNYYVNMCKNAGIADDQRGITAVINNPEEVSLVRGS